ncbi:unnamed protein product [Pelagomonas calceolata]|uniref:EF-hand domain-containing protein n=1 Tax=Pelagomonas calceolata TaxID=35677 RepID=A0A8J2SJ39_9STRA|nr:unnamed protein product [Pelagomonas calceolata]
MVLEWLKGATGVFSAGDRGAARSPAQARPPARRVRIQEDAKAAAAARVTREKEKARKDTPRKKNQSRAARAPSSRLKDDFVVDKKVLGEGHYGVVRRCSPRADPQELSGPELTQLRDVFREIDTDGSGTISTAELRRALEPHVAHRADSGGLEAGDRDAAQSLMEAADVSGDQQIDYREFIAATMQRQLYLREENVRKVFEHLDVDDSGDISVENLVALTGSKKKAEELIGEGDLDHSKTISYEEFKKLMHTAS